MRVLLSAFFLFCSICVRAEFVQKSWTVNDELRKALVWMPEETNNTPPVVFAFHGHGGGAKSAARSFKMHEIWPEAVVV